jgi:GNAT superfamily N-acetyltransferase
MAVEIRPGRADEVDAILPMYEWLFEPPGYRPRGWDPGRAAAALAEAISSDRSAVLVADGGERLAGFCTAYLDLNSVRFGLRCWVEDLAVAAESRATGIGGSLLDAAADWARSRGATHLELDTGLARVDSQRFYQRRHPDAVGYGYSWRL